MGRRRASKPKPPKRLAYKLLPPEDYKDAYKMLARLVTEHHREIKHARIMLAFCTSWRADVDGRQRLGQCKRASDLDRQLAPVDFVILLQRDFWQRQEVTDDQRRALLDHELCHATVKLDPVTHDPMEDEDGRIVYRLRQHDVEEFSEIIERHGCYKRDLEHFARALARSKQGRLALDEEPKASTTSAPSTATH